MRRVSLICLFVLAIAAVCIAARPHASYAAQDREAVTEAASAAHPAGTDVLGRDRLTRVAVAALLGLSGAFAAALVTTGIAALVGIGTALGPTFLRAPALLVCDAFLALPWLFLLMMVRSGVPLQTAPLFSVVITFLLLALLGWPACARAVYGNAAAMRQADWMIQARAVGLSDVQLMLRHILPQLGPLLLPQLLISIPAFLMAEANLGTLGLGLSEPLPSWGSMLLELDSSAMLATTHWIYLPIILLVVSLMLLELLLKEV